MVKYIFYDIPNFLWNKDLDAIFVDSLFCEIILIWHTSMPFYSILEGNCPEKQTGQGNAGGMNILTVL